jgi:hypothetical protein
MLKLAFFNIGKTKKIPLKSKNDSIKKAKNALACIHPGNLPAKL